jgi:prevent-host-death family protein
MVSKPARTVSASEFEARCLALIDEVAETGEELVITKHGRVRARIVPEDNDELTPDERLELRKKLAGSVTYIGDIVSPLYPDYAPPPLPGDEDDDS